MPVKRNFSKSAKSKSSKQKTPQPKTDLAKTAAKVWKELTALFEPFKQTDAAKPSSILSPEKTREEVRAKPKKVPSFQTVVREFRRHIHLDKNMEQALAVTFAVALSIRLPGDPVWLFLVGPAGSGKTLLLRSLEDSEHCHYESKLTSQTLVSGWNPSDGSDPSLLNSILGKCLILKDYTEVLTMPQAAQEEMYGTFRGIYDGQVSRSYGNGVVRAYRGHISMVAGVTHAIHGDSRASLGERFIKYEFIRDDHDSEVHIRAAINGMDSMADAERSLRGISSAFLDQTIDLNKLSQPPEWLVTRLVGLSQVISFLRANVSRHWRHETLIHRPVPEIGTRLAKQLVKLAQCLAIVFGMKTIDRRCYQIIEQVAFDTCAGWHLDIIRVLMSRYPKALNVYELAELAQMSPKSVGQKCNDLLDLKAVRCEKEKKINAGRGQPKNLYAVSEILARYWKKAKIGQ